MFFCLFVRYLVIVLCLRDGFIAEEFLERRLVDAKLEPCVV